MSETEFPPNSDKSKLGEYEEKNIKQVTSSPVIRRKKGLGRQFKNIFFSGDAKSSLAYGFDAVIVPGLRELLFDFGRDTLEKLIMGQSRRQRSAPPSGATGYVNYSRYAMGQQQRQPPRMLTQRGRARHDFDEIILETRQEAEDVLEQMYELVDRFGSASVSDLYELVGVKPAHTDEKWGWEELRGAGYSRVRGGYLLDLPDPEPLN